MKNPFELTKEQQKKLDYYNSLPPDQELSDSEADEYGELLAIHGKRYVVDCCIEYCVEQELPDPSHITRDGFRESAFYDENVAFYMRKHFPKFSSFKKAIVEAQGIRYDTTTTTASKVLDSKKSKRYFVTGAVAGQPVDQDFFAAVKQYCKANSAELVVLPIRPITNQDAYFSYEFLEQVDHFGGDFEFNSNLRAKDFKLHAQQINPLTGLGRFGQKACSIIVAHTKMFMKVEPVANGKYPHILHSTGTITRPTDYRQIRSGMLAEQDHRMSGLIVEVHGEKFHIRQAIWNTEKKFFFDLDKRYHPNKISDNKIKSFVMGDLHAGQHDNTVLGAWLEIINHVKSEHVFLHDALDGTSISHHAEGDFLQLCAHKPEYARTLESELNHFGELISQMVSVCDTKWVMVPSNHPEWLERYLRYGKYARHGDQDNHVLSLELAQAFIRDGQNPIEYYLKKHFKHLNKHIVWLKRGDDWYIGGRQHAAHGDKTHSGLRGSFSGHEASYGSVIHGHTHSPFIIRDIVCVGTTTPLQVHYTEGQPTKWLNTSGIVDEYGNFQLISVIDGEWRL